MKFLLSILMITILTISSGCSVVGVTPETNNQKLLQVKLTYSAILDAALKYQKQGLLSVSTEKKLSKAFKDFRSLEISADAALALSDNIAFDNQLAAMQSVILILQSIVDKTATNKGASYNGKHINSIGHSIRLSISSHQTTGRDIYSHA